MKKDKKDESRISELFSNELNKDIFNERELNLTLHKEYDWEDDLSL